MQCSELSTEEQAALGARLRADLAVRHTAGHLAVECGQRDGWVLWTPDGGASLREPVTFDADGHSVDRILEAVDRVLKESDARARHPPLSAASPSAEPLPAKAPQAREQPRPKPTWLVAVGARVSLWSKEIIGVAGPHLGVGALVGNHLRLSAEGGAAWGLRAAGGLKAFSWNGRVGADWNFHVLDVGLGLRGALLEARGTTTEDRAPAFGADLRTRAAVPLGPLLLRVGPELLVQFQSKTDFVRNGVEAFKIPVVSAALSLDIELNGRSLR